MKRFSRILNMIEFLNSILILSCCVYSIMIENKIELLFGLILFQVLVNIVYKIVEN